MLDKETKILGSFVGLLRPVSRATVFCKLNSLLLGIGLPYSLPTWLREPVKLGWLLAVVWAVDCTYIRTHVD